MSKASLTGTPPKILTWLALLVAILASAGSIYLTVGLKRQGCPLCFYQRTFALSVLGVLVMGVLTGLGRSAPLSLLALPLAVAGLGVASFHVYLEWTGKLECPAGVFDVGSAPAQSLVAFLALFVLLAYDALRWAGRVSFLYGPAMLVALGLGGVFAWGCVLSAPPLPEPPPKPYAEKPNVCRPPYVEPQ
jgi:disulfide bond formation protein DsbB